MASALAPRPRASRPRAGSRRRRLAPARAQPARTRKRNQWRAGPRRRTERIACAWRAPLGGADLAGIYGTSRIVSNDGGTRLSAMPVRGREHRLEQRAHLLAVPLADADGHADDLTARTDHERRGDAGHTPGVGDLHLRVEED